MLNNRNVRFGHKRFKYVIIITMNERQNIYIHNGGTMTHKWGIIIATAMVAMTTLACNAVDEMSNGYNNANPTPMAKPWIPPSQRGDLTVERENELLSMVEFNLDGTPVGDTALFIDATMIAQLYVGKTTRVPLVGNERCDVDLKIRNADGEWEHVRDLGCIDHTPYASINFTVNGMDTTESHGAWR